ncbi:phytanoyl-CoA dioxygenase family protein [Paenibacillus rhizovicinus]|uniref:Phytanoyl-CoA dioxygenase family protein n=1 Tax=Paenibacillus rhizovicinus TaxID=2704463 RepID=A0A6C0P331_9BACL|nr:phytanoyl-CoA dioxygenase family protein [Paenibacillus rhizovicinus]QHW32751.1 phytanoyl-CoA dioxygenase family protein [Paenibacillus rhizovicinus]
MKDQSTELSLYSEFFRNNGYVLVKNAVPKALCDKAISRMFAFMGQSPDDRDGWYEPAAGMDGYFEDQERGMLPFFHDQSLWDIRMYPRVYDIFAELLGERKLWVSLDRVNMKLPKRENKGQLNANFIHWDTDTSNLKFPLTIPSGGLQGVLYLADTFADQGGFQCVPDIFRDLEGYIKRQPANRDPRVPDITGYDVMPIPGEAGDLLIWDVLLPHGNGENLSDDIRFAQYITMHPAPPVSHAKSRIDSWRNYSSTFLPEDPRGWERTHNDGPAQLTELGWKLLGIDSW